MSIPLDACTFLTGVQDDVWIQNIELFSTNFRFCFIPASTLPYSSLEHCNTRLDGYFLHIPAVIRRATPQLEHHATVDSAVRMQLNSAHD
jgi:hypothetical protein